MFEEFNEEYFLSQARAFGDELGVDTRTGSVYMDSLPICGNFLICLHWIRVMRMCWMIRQQNGA